MWDIYEKIQKRRKVDLVIFGHMHNRLKRNLGLREMFKIDSKGTIYFNTAVVLIVGNSEIASSPSTKPS